MADWTTPPWSQLVAGKPWTDEKAAAAFENPIAIAEGAPDAPRVRIGALQRLNPGDAVRVRSDAEVSGNAITGIAFAFLQQGTIRVSFQHRNIQGNSGAATVVRTRAGVDTVLATFANSSSYVTRTVDCPVSPGDRLSVVNLGDGFTSYLRNCRMQTGGEDVFPGSVVAAVLEGNTYA